MSHRTTIVLPEDVKAEAVEMARDQGISFGELVREALALRLAKPARETAGRRRRRLAVDAMLRFGQHGPEGPKDLSDKLDDYLYGNKRVRRRS